MAGALVRSIILGGAAAQIRAAGRRPDAVARKAGIPAQALRDPDLLVSGRAVMRLFAVAAEVCGDRNWGLRMAEQARFAAIVGPLWVLLRNAGTVRALCQDMARHYDLYSSAALMRFEPVSHGALLTWSPASGVVQDEIQIAEFALGVILNEIRPHGAPGWSPPAVWFRHGAPRDLRLHRRIFGPQLRFNANANAIEIDAAMLERPVREAVTRDRALVLGLLRQQETAPRSSWRLQAESVVRSLLPFVACRATDVARALGMPVRTLQARLQAEGSSLRAVKEAVRRDLAQKYVQGSDLSATQITGLLGYTEVATFSRAMLRWNGQGFRRSRQAAGSSRGGGVVRPEEGQPSDGQSRARDDAPASGRGRVTPSSSAREPRRAGRRA